LGPQPGRGSGSGECRVARGEGGAILAQAHSPQCLIPLKGRNRGSEHRMVGKLYEGGGLASPP
jgi:hypothetical protein